MHRSLRGSGRSRGGRFSSKLHILWEWCQHLSHRSLSNKTRVRCHGTLRVRWSRQQMPGGPKPTVWTKICSLNDYITLEKVRGFELPKKKSLKLANVARFPPDSRYFLLSESCSIILLCLLFARYSTYLFLQEHNKNINGSDLGLQL